MYLLIHGTTSKKLNNMGSDRNKSQKANYCIIPFI